LDGFLVILRRNPAYAVQKRSNYNSVFARKKSVKTVRLAARHAQRRAFRVRTGCFTELSGPGAGLEKQAQKCQAPGWQAGREAARGR
jgi:hypothetical protein